MSERYPEDSALLAMTQDADTGAQYIATGQSPYYAEFRRLIHRMLTASRRANDLRVYQDGDLTVGVRGGRCVIGSATVVFTGVTGQSLANNATHYLWLNASGSVASSTSSLPADRTAFIPLAQVTCWAGAITQIVDLRGQSFLFAPSLGWFSVTASASQINQALASIGSTVTAANLTTLTQSPSSLADSLHTHTQVLTDADSQTEFRLINNNDGSSANIALIFDLPNRLSSATRLMADPITGWLAQSFGDVTYCLLGTIHCQSALEGELLYSVSDKLMGVIPIDGVVSDVILSVGTNMVSSESTDGIVATVKVNGAALCSTDPQMTSADGAGFRSTSQGAGIPAVVAADGTQNVIRGSILTVDLTPNATAAITTQPANVVVLVVIRPARPE